MFINLTFDNISTEHLCCIIRSRKPNAGIEAKRNWLSARLAEGHVFRKLDANGCCFIEYAPLETAWVPIVGENYLYIYCLWVNGEFKGKGYGKELIEYCIADARAKGKSGICMLGAARQKNWLSSQSFVQKYGFIEADSTDYGYKLFALSFDGKFPKFTDRAKRGEIEGQELTIFYSDQCPFIAQKIAEIIDFCVAENIPLKLNHIQTLQQAKDLPAVFNNWAVFYKGKFISVNLIDAKSIEKLIKDRH